MEKGVFDTGRKTVTYLEIAFVFLRFGPLAEPLQNLAQKAFHLFSNPKAVTYSSNINPGTNSIAKNDMVKVDAPTRKGGEPDSVKINGVWYKVATEKLIIIEVVEPTVTTPVDSTGKVNWMDIGVDLYVPYVDVGTYDVPSLDSILALSKSDNGDPTRNRAEALGQIRFAYEHPSFSGIMKEDSTKRVEAMKFIFQSAKYDYIAPGDIPVYVAPGGIPINEYAINALIEAVKDFDSFAQAFCDADSTTRASVIEALKAGYIKLLDGGAKPRHLSHITKALEYIAYNEIDEGGDSKALKVLRELYPFSPNPELKKTIESLEKPK
jgi:hypothetical protein